MARSQVMSLQSSKEHKVNGMTTRAVYSPHPSPLPQGEGVVRAGIILGGTLSPQEEGKASLNQHHLNPAFSEPVQALRRNAFIDNNHINPLRINDFMQA